MPACNERLVRSNSYIHTLNFKCTVQEHFSHFTDLGRRERINEISV